MQVSVVHIKITKNIDDDNENDHDNNDDSDSDDDDDDDDKDNNDDDDNSYGNRKKNCLGCNICLEHKFAIFCIILVALLRTYVIFDVNCDISTSIVALYHFCDL